MNIKKKLSLAIILLSRLIKLKYHLYISLQMNINRIIMKLIFRINISVFTGTSVTAHQAM